MVNRQYTCCLSAEYNCVAHFILQVQQSAAAVAAAEAAASAAQSAAAQQQAEFAQLETRVAAAESESTSLRLQLAAKAGEVASMSGNVKSASRKLQRLAAAASDMVGMLERMGGLQPHDVAALLAQLVMVMGAAGRPLHARHHGLARQQLAQQLAAARPAVTQAVECSWWLTAAAASSCWTIWGVCSSRCRS